MFNLQTYVSLYYSSSVQLGIRNSINIYIYIYIYIYIDYLLTSFVRSVRKSICPRFSYRPSDEGAKSVRKKHEVRQSKARNKNYFLVRERLPSLQLCISLIALPPFFVVQHCLRNILFLSHKLSIGLFRCLPACLSTSLPLGLSVCLPTFVPVPGCMSVIVPVCLSMSVSQFSMLICQSVSLSV